MLAGHPGPGINQDYHWMTFMHICRMERKDCGWLCPQNDVRAVLERAECGIEASWSAVSCFVSLGKEPGTPKFKLRSLPLVPASFDRFSNATRGTVCGAGVSETGEWVVRAKVFG